MNLFSKLSWTLAALGLAVYGLSFLGYIFPFLNLILFFTAIAIVLNLTWRRLEYGVLAAFFELLLGHKGYLFSLDVGGHYVFSLRLAIFLIVMVAWLITVIRQRRFALARTRFLFPLLAFVAVIAAGALVGYLNKYSLTAIFLDFNGYLYLALALPLFEVVKNKNFVPRLLNILVGGVMAICLLSLFLCGDFYLTKQWARPNLAESISTESATIEEAASSKFAISGISNRLYDKSGKPVEYRWQKDLGLGMISFVGGRFFRVFAIGQIWAVFGFLLAAYLILTRPWRAPGNRWFWLFAGLCLATVIVSFSRSFWIGLGAGTIALLCFLPRKRALVTIAVLIVLITLGLGGTYLIAPQSTTGITERLASIINPSSELAGQNRLNLLTPIMAKFENRPLTGNGFGTSVIYESVVPEKQGFIKVFAYEWGYLDQLVKFGCLGLAVFFWFIWEIFALARCAIKNISPEQPLKKFIIFGLLAGIVSLLITHITSPYLNHPLGIGFLLLVAALVYLYTFPSNVIPKISQG
jgi:hypothetical protein